SFACWRTDTRLGATLKCSRLAISHASSLLELATDLLACQGPQCTVTDQLLGQLEATSQWYCRPENAHLPQRTHRTDQADLCQLATGQAMAWHHLLQSLGAGHVLPVGSQPAGGILCLGRNIPLAHHCR